MTDQSARLALPLLEAGQAQKEIFHNEALLRLDAAVQAGVETIGDNAPPPAPVAGQSWIVGPAPSGDWAGHPAALANWSASGWRFVQPVEGMTVWVISRSLYARFAGGAWSIGVVSAVTLAIDGRQVVGACQPGIADPGGGTVVDAAARAAITAILAALRNHGLIAA